MLQLNSLVLFDWIPIHLFHGMRTLRYPICLMEARLITRAGQVLWAAYGWPCEVAFARYFLNHDLRRLRNFRWYLLPWPWQHVVGAAKSILVKVSDLFRQKLVIWRSGSKLSVNCFLAKGSDLFRQIVVLAELSCSSETIHALEFALVFGHGVTAAASAKSSGVFF